MKVTWNEAGISRSLRISLKDYFILAFLFFGMKGGNIFLKFIFCFSIEECRNIIMQFGVREVTAAQVARVLGMMARTHSGLTDGIPLQVSVEVNYYTI